MLLHTHKFSVAFVLLGLSTTWTGLAQTTSPKPEPWLLQSVHIIVGDAVDGFRKTCLIVDVNGEYHRERLRQVSRNGRAQFEWEAPEVFEGKLTQADLIALHAILETPEFSSVNSTVGDSRTLISKLVFGPQGAIRPHGNIEIITVAVARPDALQVFELADVDVARRQESLRAFLDWINGMERRQAQRFAGSLATNCSALIATAHAPAGGALLATGLSLPKAIYAPGPHPPHGTAKPKPVAVELLINPDGSVTASLQGHASPAVEQTVLDTVRKWKFEPARILGVPIAMTVGLKVEFRGK
jgi:TonB family protein